MTGALILLAVTVVTGLVLRLLHKPDAADAPRPESPASTDGEECCGLHEVCEKQGRQMLAPEYFDDEELDRFAGRGKDDYAPADVEEFRDVLFTLLPQDVEPWGFSLRARGIEMPPEIHDEWVMLATEYKTASRQ